MINKSSIIDSLLESFNRAKEEIDVDLDSFYTNIRSRFMNFVGGREIKMSYKARKRLEKLCKVLLYILYFLCGAMAFAIMMALLPFLFLYAIGYIAMKSLNEVFRYIMSELNAMPSC